LHKIKIFKLTIDIHKQHNIETNKQTNPLKFQALTIDILACLVPRKERNLKFM